MLPRRAIPSSNKADLSKEKTAKKKPTLDEFVDKHDWSGALGLLNFESNTKQAAGDYSESESLTMWMAYCAFHLGDYRNSCTVSFCLSDDYRSHNLTASGRTNQSSTIRTCLESLQSMCTILLG